VDNRLRPQKRGRGRGEEGGRDMTGWDGTGGDGTGWDGRGQEGRGQEMRGWDGRRRDGRGRDGRGRDGRGGNECVRANVPCPRGLELHLYGCAMSMRTCHVHADLPCPCGPAMFARTLGCVLADGFLPAWTVKSIRE
jgi:hypothetical protein